MKTVIFFLTALLPLALSGEPEKKPATSAEAFDGMLKEAQAAENVGDRMKQNSQSEAAFQMYRKALDKYRALRDGDSPPHREEAAAGIKRLEGKLADVDVERALNALIQTLRKKVELQVRKKMPGATAEWEAHDSAILILAEEVKKLRREVSELKARHP